MLQHGWRITPRFHIEPEQRFGIRAADIEAPLRKFSADPVGTVDGLTSNGHCSASFDNECSLIG